MQKGQERTEAKKRHSKLGNEHCNQGIPERVVYAADVPWNLNHVLARGMHARYARLNTITERLKLNFSISPFSIMEFWANLINVFKINVC